MDDISRHEARGGTATRAPPSMRYNLRIGWPAAPPTKLEAAHLRLQLALLMQHGLGGGAAQRRWGTRDPCCSPEAFEFAAGAAALD